MPEQFDIAHVVTGLERALHAYPDVRSMSIDTWGVDYVLLRGEEEVAPCYAYRDARTEAVISFCGSTHSHPTGVHVCAVYFCRFA